MLIVLLRLYVYNEESCYFFNWRKEKKTLQTKKLHSTELVQYNLL